MFSVAHFIFNTLKVVRAAPRLHGSLIYTDFTSLFNDPGLNTQGGFQACHYHKAQKRAIVFCTNYITIYGFSFAPNGKYESAIDSDTKT